MRGEVQRLPRGILTLGRTLEWLAHLNVKVVVVTASQKSSACSGSVEVESDGEAVEEQKARVTLKHSALLAMTMVLVVSFL